MSTFGIIKNEFTKHGLHESTPGHKYLGPCWFGFVTIVVVCRPHNPWPERFVTVTVSDKPTMMELNKHSSIENPLDDDEEDEMLASPSTSRDELAEVRKLVDAENKKVGFWRLVVCAGIVGVGAGVTWMTHTFLTKEEHSGFEKAVRYSSARRISVVFVFFVITVFLQLFS